MPTLSASDYTQYLKFKAAMTTPIRPGIQTRDNVALSQSVINANVLTSQAAFVSAPFTTTDVVSPATVTDASTTTITTARSQMIASADSATPNVITFTTQVPHGLGAVGDIVTITIQDVAHSFSTNPNGEAPMTITGPSTFTKSAEAVTGTATPNTGGISGRAYYTTSVDHGLVVGDVVTITNLTTFTTSNATVLTVPTSTSFALPAVTPGGGLTTVTGAAGSISGFVYYTTSPDHMLTPKDRRVQVISITGLTTEAFNLTLVPVFQSVSATVFRVRSDATGTAVTGGSGVLTVTTYTNITTALTGIARVQGQQVVQTRATPTAKATLSFAGMSGALGSSAIQRPGGLPSGFKSSTSTYTRLPQQAGW